MKRVAFIIGGVVVLAVLGALIAPSFIDWTRYKSEIEAEARQLTGRDVRIGGGISFSLLPSPALSAEEISVANLPGASTLDMIRLESLRIQVAFWPLLGGNVRVEQIVLVKPLINLEIMQDGSRNWLFEEESGEDEATEGGEGFEHVSLENFVIENGRISFRNNSDPKPGRKARAERIDDINAVIVAETLRGPIAAKGSMAVRSVPMAFDLGIGRFDRTRAVPVKVELGMTEQNAAAQFSGSLSELSPDARVNGKIELDGADLAAFLAALGVGDEGGRFNLLNAVREPFSAESRLSGDLAHMKFDDVALVVGATRGNGAASVALNGAPTIDVAFQINSIDFDALSRQEQGTGLASGPVTLSLGGGAANPAEIRPLLDFAIPSAFAGSLDISVGAIAYRDGVIRQSRLNATLADGAIDVTRLTALLPGGSDVVLSGRIAPAEDSPRFDGKLKAASNNLRALLEWWGNDVASVPKDRLTKLALTSDLRIEKEIAQFYNVELALDTAKITGGAAYAFRDRPSFSLDIAVDRLNLDAYSAALASASGERAGNESGEAPSGQAADFSMLNDFDANYRIAVGRFTNRQVTLKDLKLEGALIDGAATVTALSVEGSAGAKLALSGQAGDFANDVSYRAEGAVEGRNVQEFLAAAGIEPPSILSHLDAAKLALTVEGTRRMTALGVRGSVGETKLLTSGEIVSTDESASINFNFEVKSDSFAAFSSQWDLPVAPVSRADDGPFSLKGTIAGDLKATNLNVRARLAEGSASARGRLSFAEDGVSYELSTRVRNADFYRLLRGVGVDAARPSKVELKTSLSASASGNGDLVTLKDLKLSVGDSAVEGEASLDFRGERPKLQAALSAKTIAVEPFLDSAVTGPKEAKREKAGSSPGARRWSRDLIDLAWLSTFDAAVTVSADRLVFRAYEFRKASAKASLDDGALTIREFKSGLFGGALDAKATLKVKDVLAVSTTFSLSGASFEEALNALADVAPLTGAFAMNGTFTAEGRTQSDMIASLSGSALLKSKSGSVRGADLRRLSTGVSSVTAMDDISKLTKSVTSGGETRFTALEASIRASKGRIVFKNLAAESSLGAAKGDLDLNLPQWTVSLNGEAKLADRPELPPIGLSLSGPVYAPRRDFKMAEIERYLGRQVSATVLQEAIDADAEGIEKLLGNGAGGSAPAPSPSPAPKPAAPAVSGAGNR